MGQFTKLFQPGRIGTLEIKNRIVMAPMGTHAHNEDGSVNDRITDFYVERARGGVGLIMGQSSCILKESVRETITAIYDDKFIPPLRRLTDAVHQHGARIGWQVEHGGKVLTSSTADYIVALGPSPIPWVHSGIAPKEATDEDIERMIEGFAEGARRVKDAGFDLVEIHGCHGDLVSSFLSPLDNRRQDQYGGSVEKRARFACEIIQRVRQKVGPDFPISFRFSGADYLEGGISIEDSVQAAPLFIKAGANVLHISAGQWESYKWGIPDYTFPDGLNVHLAGAIKKAVGVPVIAAGKIHHPSHAEQILQEGKADFVTMGRALLADAELPNKAREGRSDEIRHCIYCMGCMIKSAKSAHDGISCTRNPAVLREREFILKSTTSPKRIMVIGGGVAGMEAARVLAERGHSVTLYEADGKLGGQWNIASQEPQKEAFASVIEDMSRGLEKAKVRVVYNKAVTPEFVRREKPQVVVVATGAKPATLGVPGVNNRNVVQAVDVFTGKAHVGATVVVVGGKYRAMEAATLLAEQGKKVSIVTLRQLGQNGQPIVHWVYLVLRDRLIKDDVHIYTHARVREIKETGVYIDFEQEVAFLKADTVVLAVGARSENVLADQLKGIVPEVYRIGDCVEPRDAMEAIREGAEIGRFI